MKTMAIRNHRLLQPLTQLYREAGQGLPAVEWMNGHDIPQPQCDLLTQRGDMTPALEEFYKDRLYLRLFGRHLNDALYSRHVALLLEGNNAPVAFGAIEINFSLLAPHLREKILECQRPLGRILLTDCVEHRSEPQAFLRVESDSLMNQALELVKPCVLYGRCNHLLNAQEQIIAKVVEIMAPA